MYPYRSFLDLNWDSSSSALTTFCGFLDSICKFYKELYSKILKSNYYILKSKSNHSLYMWNNYFHYKVCVLGNVRIRIWFWFQFSFSFILFYIVKKVLHLAKFPNKAELLYTNQAVIPKTPFVECVVYILSGLII